MAENLDEILSLVGGVNELLARSPRGAEIFERIRSQQISVDQGVKELILLAREEGLISELQKASESVSTMIPGLKSETGLGSQTHPLMMETSTGIPQLNPLYEAAIAERASLDGDVPELRYGPLPRDARPAIPVQTDSMDPVLVGLMLRRASEEVFLRLDVKMTEHAQIQDAITSAARKVAVETGTSLALAEEAAKRLMPLAPTGVEGYRAGEIPAPILINSPTVDELGALLPAERRVCSFRALATTQGRVSLSRPIQKVILQELLHKGYEVEIGTPSPSSSISTVWAVNAWGPEDLAENFNYVIVAAKSLAKDLMVKAGESPLYKTKKGLVLEVFPYNGIADRQFGWVARLGYRRTS